MMFRQLLLAAIVVPCLSVAYAEGPGVSEMVFLTNGVDVTVSGLTELPAYVATGDLDGARRIFADSVRKAANGRQIIPEWYDANKLNAKKLDQLRDEAAQVMDYHVSACGIPYHFEDHKIDWTTNPTYNAYREWPWQLGRQQFLDTLAQYYALTGDEKAAETWRDMVDGWISQCPPPPEGTPDGATISWRTIDAGIRVARWCRQFHVFARSSSLSDAFWVRFFRSVYDHGLRLERSRSIGNWRIIEQNGLLHIAVLFPFLSRSLAWQNSVLAEYERQLDLQVYPDGFQFELSPGYHNVIPHLYGGIIDLFRLMRKEPPAFAVRAVELSSEVYLRLSRPDRAVPALNDSSEPSVIGAMESALRYVPQREDFRWMATNGREGNPPDYLSYAFPYAGAVAFRTSWEKDAVWAYMDCSPFGRAHQHEDKLNILLSAYGQNMVVEGGNYAYDTSEMRRYVKSTRAHNTVLVDGLDQNTRATWVWNPEDIARKADFDSLFTEKFDAARATFDAGYGKGKTSKRVRDKTHHVRTAIFQKSAVGLPPFLVVVDRLFAPDERQRTYDILWHLESCELKLKKSSFDADFGKGVYLSAAFSDPGAVLRDMKGSLDPFQGWMPIYPPGDHEHRPIPTPVLKGMFSGSVRVVGVLFPYRNGQVTLAGVEASCNPSEFDYVIVTTDGRRYAFREPFSNKEEGI